MMMMKKSIAVLTCVLLCSSLLVLASGNVASPKECCFKFYPKQLSAKNVVSYHYTDSECSTEGIIFIMSAGRRFCVKPTVKWVQDIIKAEEWNQDQSTDMS